jgi:hypothetical protein
MVALRGQPAQAILFALAVVAPVAIRSGNTFPTDPTLGESGAGKRPFSGLFLG